MAQPKGGTTMAITKRYRNKKTFYQAELFVKGVRITTKNFSTKREAVFWQETERHKLKLNSLDFNNYMTFEDCVNRFFEDARTRMILSTSQKYESQKTYFCSSPLAKVKMSELKGFKVVEWIGWLKKQPTAKNPRRKSFIKEYKLLKTILIWYKDFLNEDFNVPVTKKHRQLCIFKQNTPRRPDYFMKPEDAKAWIEWLKENRSNPGLLEAGFFYASHRSQSERSLWDMLGCSGLRTKLGQSNKTGSLGLHNKNPCLGRSDKNFRFCKAVDASQKVAGYFSANETRNNQ